MERQLHMTNVRHLDTSSVEGPARLGNQPMTGGLNSVS
jgi:hypothetical protein